MKIDKRKSIISLLLATSISLNASLLTSCSPSKKPTESNDSSAVINEENSIYGKNIIIVDTNIEGLEIEKEGINKRYLMLKVLGINETQISETESQIIIGYSNIDNDEITALLAMNIDYENYHVDKTLFVYKNGLEKFTITDNIMQNFNTSWLWNINALKDIIEIKEYYTLDELNEILNILNDTKTLSLNNQETVMI